MVFCYDGNPISTMLFAFSISNSSWINFRIAADSFAEIGASEGEGTVSSNDWFISIKSAEVVLARCNLSNNYIALRYQLVL